MEYAIHRISLDIRSTKTQTNIRVKQADSCRKIYITLTEGGFPYHIAKDCSANFSAVKPDGNYIHNVCQIDGDTIIYTFTEQTVPVVGIMDCEISLYDGNKNRITSPHFNILVEERVYNGEEIVSSPEANVLDELIGRAEHAVAQAEGVVENINFRVNNTFANAFKGKLSGAVVRVDDVSPIEHMVKVKVSGDIDPSTVKLARCGKNLVTNLGRITEGTGIKWTLNDDGTVIANGTAETRCVYNFEVIHSNSSLVGETVTLSGCPSGGGKDKYCIYQRNYGQYDIGNTKTFNIYNDNFNAWGIQIEQGVTVTDLVFKPQLELGSIATEFETSYIESGMSFHDGECEFASVYPTMTVLTNTENAIIDCEYNKDSNKVYEELYDFLEQGGLTGTAPAARIANVNIFADQWVGTESPYSQVVSIEGITSNSQVDLTPSAEQLAIFYNKDLAFVTENENGVVTVYAIGQKPANDYTIQATITEVIR